jgi:hypothetical protein
VLGLRGSSADCLPHREHGTWGHRRDGRDDLLSHLGDLGRDGLLLRPRQLGRGGGLLGLLELRDPRPELLLNSAQMGLKPLLRELHRVEGRIELGRMLCLFQLQKQLPELRRHVLLHQVQ